MAFGAPLSFESNLRLAETLKLIVWFWRRSPSPSPSRDSGGRYCAKLRLVTDLYRCIYFQTTWHFTSQIHRPFAAISSSQRSLFFTIQVYQAKWKSESTKRLLSTSDQTNDDRREVKERGTLRCVKCEEKHIRVTR